MSPARAREVSGPLCSPLPRGLERSADWEVSVQKCVGWPTMERLAIYFTAGEVRRGEGGRLVFKLTTVQSNLSRLSHLRLRATEASSPPTEPVGSRRGHLTISPGAPRLPVACK